MALADPRPQHHRLRLTRAHLRPAPPGRAPRPLHPAHLQPAGRHAAAGDADHRVGQGPHAARRSPDARRGRTPRSATRPGTPARRAPLLFPVADEALDAADPTALAAATRDLPLVYVGNQYDRDDAFARSSPPPPRTSPHCRRQMDPTPRDWPHVHFTGRIPFAQVEATYRRSAGHRLAAARPVRAAGQMTQRLFEAVLAGCLPLTPNTIRHADRFTPPDLHVRDGAEVIARIQALQAVAGTGRHADLIAASLRRLDLFRISRQLRVLDQILDPTRHRPARGRTR